MIVLHYLQFRLRAAQQNVANRKWTITILSTKTPSMHTHSVFGSISEQNKHDISRSVCLDSILMSFYAILVIDEHLWTQMDIKQQST